MGLTGCGFQAAPQTTGDAAAAVDAVDAPPDAIAVDGAMSAAREKLITIDPGKVAGNLTNFPVWIRLDSDNDLKARALADGTDIYFTLESGAPLEYELQRWNTSNGELAAWVRLDLSDTTATTLVLRYGDPGPAHAANALLTFSNQFAAVWHMDDPLGGATTVADALGQRMGTAVNGPTSASATLGRGIAFDGTDDRVTFTNPLSGNQPHTISAWVDVVAPGSGFSSVLTVGNAATNQSRFLHTHYQNVGAGLFGNDLQPSNTGIDGQGPKLVHWVYDPSGSAGTSTLYINGVSVASKVHGGTINTTGTEGYLGYALGAWGPGGNTPNPLHGTLDEVRISTAARTAPWIATEFANQGSPQTFYTVGLEQPAP